MASRTIRTSPPHTVPGATMRSLLGAALSAERRDEQLTVTELLMDKDLTLSTKQVSKIGIEPLRIGLDFWDFWP
jgi:hypothetical protein